MADPQRPQQTGRFSNLWKWVLIAVIIIVVIIIIILIAYYAGTSFAKSAKNTKTTEWPGYGGDAGAGGQKFTYENAQQLKKKDLKSNSIKNLKDLCKSFNKRLAVPRTNFDVKQILETLKQYHMDAECENYALGVQLNPEVRYKSLDGAQKWPSYNSDKDSGVPIEGENRDCAVVKAAAGENGTDITLEEETNCANVTTFTCILLRDVSDKCNKDLQSECLVPTTILLESDNATIVEAYDAANALQTTSMSIMFIDKDYIFDELKGLTETTCLAFNVKYVFEYVDIYTLYKNKAIKIEGIQNPEMECVKINGETRELSRTDCDDVGCPICF